MIGHRCSGCFSGKMYKLGSEETRGMQIRLFSIADTFDQARTITRNPMVVHFSTKAAFAYGGVFALGLSVCPGPGLGLGAKEFRPPAVPLVVHDPYFSIWSFFDELAADWPVTLDGKASRPGEAIRVDGKAYRPMGLPIAELSPSDAPGGARGLPDAYHLLLADGGGRGPADFPNAAGFAAGGGCAGSSRDVSVLARAIGRWTDHLVDIYYDNSAELAVNEPGRFAGSGGGREISCG